MTVHIAVLATSSFTVPLAYLQRTRLLRSSVFDLSFFSLCLPSSCSVKRATEQAALVSFSEDVYTKTVKVKLSHITSQGDSETVRNIRLPSLLRHSAQLGLQCFQLYALAHYPKESAWVPWLLNGDRRIRTHREKSALQQLNTPSIAVIAAVAMLLCLETKYRLRRTNGACRD